MAFISSILLVLLAGGLYYRLTMKAVERYKEAWIDDRGFDVRIMAYTALYYLIALYAVAHA
ncbi:hypothetical protein [Thermococcus sp.]